MSSIQQIRNAMRAVPFRPFSVYLEDGQSYLVKHPELISLPTADDGRDLTVHDGDGPHLIDLDLVSCAG